MKLDRTGKMKMTGSARSNSCLAMIPKADCCADIVGYLIGTQTNTRVLALIGNPDATTYELLFSFSTPGDKEQFLDLVRSNEHMGSD